MISADGDRFVRYSSNLTVTKGLHTSLDDTKEIYERQLHLGEMLARWGLAPRILKKDITDGDYITWVMEDAGLPITEKDVADANALLDVLYDTGIVYSWSIHQSHFLRGFDGILRIIDFQHTEQLPNPITRDKRIYLQWRAS